MTEIIFDVTTRRVGHLSTPDTIPSLQLASLSRQWCKLKKQYFSVITVYLVTSAGSVTSFFDSGTVSFEIGTCDRITLLLNSVNIIVQG